MRNLIKTLSILLALIMAVMMPVESLAASENTKYVSEIVTVTAESENDAKVKLEEAGYKLVPNSNLNSTLKTGVYLGYKETSDKGEALTDIAAMNMTGKFSYSDYKQLMENYKENIESEVAGLETSIEEFQQNYGAEKKNALMAYGSLNLFKDDDSGKTMGDYFLDYDFSEESTASLTDTLMQANSNIVMSLIKALTFAGNADDDTVIKKMQKTGPDGLQEKYGKVYQTVAQANKALAKDYGATADIIYKEWDCFYNYLKDIEKDVITLNSDDSLEVKEGALEIEESEEIFTDGLSDEEKDALTDMDALSQVPEVAANTTEYALYALLYATSFGEGTLLDYFNRPASEVDKSELYVLVDSLSEGQRSQTSVTDIKDILLTALSEDEESEESTATEDYAELIENIDPVSIYDGIDRSVFEDGVAFTSDAVTHEKLTGSSWLDKLTGITDTSSDYWNTTTIVCWAATCGLAVLGVGATLMSKWIATKLPELQHAKVAAYCRYFNNFSIYKNRFMEGVGNTAAQTELIREERLYATRCKARFESAQKLLKVTTVIKVASFVLLFVALAFDIYTLVDYLTSDKPSEENIPHHIMATASTSYGEDYVYYQTVKTLDGEAADVNNHEADTTIGWLVLYTTKDTNAGDAICSDTIKIVTGSNSLGEDSYFAHLFNDSAAISTTDKLYTGVEDKANGTYITYNCEDSVLTASAISNGTYAIIAACGLIAGAAIGSIITAIALKKKKSKAEGDK